MDRNNITRRDLLIAGATAAIVGPRLLAQNFSGKPVRVAFIGVGRRGMGLLKLFLKLPGTEVRAICDINESHLNRAIKIVEKVRGYKPVGFSRDAYDYRRMLERNDFDAVIIATPIYLHTEMSVDSMLAGKHVGSEIPGAQTLEECWGLIRAKNKSGKRYMLLENLVYAQYNMMIYNMAQEGLFGELYYAECAYIHSIRSMRFNPDQTLTWRGKLKRDFIGCMYPTHALGPVSKMLDIHKGDRMTSLVSRMSKAAAIHDYAVRRFGPSSKAASYKFIAGDQCVTLIKTTKDALITIYYDTDSPRPHTIFYMLQGTRGAYDSRFGVYLDELMKGQKKWNSVTNYQEQYEHEYWRKYGKTANETGHMGGDFFVLYDFVNMVRYDREPLVDVYDSAAWSSVIPLSQESIRQGGNSVEIPDFTAGAWRKQQKRKLK